MPYILSKKYLGLRKRELSKILKEFNDKDLVANNIIDLSLYIKNKFGEEFSKKSRSLVVENISLIKFVLKNINNIQKVKEEIDRLEGAINNIQVVKIKMNDSNRLLSIGRRAY